MLVFDGRYIFPLIPLLLAVAVRALFSDGEERGLDTGPFVRRAAQLLFVFGIVFSLLYWASPFRTLTRDLQRSCVQAGRVLRDHSGPKFVSIGTGPFPEHGVGWEAGYIAGLWGKRQMVATLDHLPDSSHVEPLLEDLKKADADSLMIWGKPTDENYTSLCRRLLKEKFASEPIEIRDPSLGEVGKIFIASKNER